VCTTTAGLFFFFETRFHCVAQAGPKLGILLPQPHEYWNYRNVLLYQPCVSSFNQVHLRFPVMVLHFPELGLAPPCPHVNHTYLFGHSSSVASELCFSFFFLAQIQFFLLRLLTIQILGDNSSVSGSVKDN
jgi:hypothetical protein